MPTQAERALDHESLVRKEVDKLTFLRSAPLKFAALCIEGTTKCNAQCDHCYQSAGPKGSETAGLHSLATEDVYRVTEDALKIKSLERRLHFAGGEAFLNLDQCLEVFGFARTCGYDVVSTVTNAFWAARRALDTCERLREAGLTDMEISWDAWHRSYVSPEAISNCLDACYETGIRGTLRLLSTKTHSFEEALSWLRPHSLSRATEIVATPVFPTGRAVKKIDALDFDEFDPFESHCLSLLNLTVTAQGKVFPCCSGLDQTDGYVFGSIREQSIVEIYDAMNRSLLVRTLLCCGPGAFVPILEKVGIDVGRGYICACQLCWSIFSRPDWVNAITDYLVQSQRDAIVKVIDSLGKGANESKKSEKHS